ncbi:MAG: sugar transferase [Bacillota bacterium]|nr:sugar transferase [Bacillota bacterium]
MKKKGAVHLYKCLKRGMDIVISLFGLIIISPVLLLTSIAIKLESKGPVIFKQNRLGKDGKVFSIYKFRSMCVGAEKTGSGVYSSSSDPRVTKVGKFIRATSIDELPQFINVLKGEMSLIGPRPVLTYHPWSFEEYTDEQKKRFSVRPGLSGLAQVNGRKGLEWPNRIKYDVTYTEKCSFCMDIKIIFQTILKVFLNADNVNTGNTAVRIKAEAEESGLK